MKKRILAVEADSQDGPIRVGAVQIGTCGGDDHKTHPQPIRLMTKPTKRGGRRENAGRKAGKRRKRCTVDMLPDTWAAIDQRRGKLSRGRFLETVIEKP